MQAILREQREKAESEEAEKHRHENTPKQYVLDK